MELGSVWFAWAIGLVGVMPALFIFYAHKTNHISDIRLIKRQDRFGPFSVASIGMILTILIFFKLGVPTPLLLFLMSGLLILLIATIVTFFWKISIHALAISAIVMTVNVSTYFHYWYLFALLPIVMWSRIELKRHNMAQVAAGALVGLVVVYATYKIYGI
jgi:membrane-associated phospholipid phosphatase